VVEQQYEEYGYTLAELGALCRTKDRHIARLEAEAEKRACAPPILPSSNQQVSPFMRYRKKPVAITAWQWRLQPRSEWPDYMRDYELNSKHIALVAGSSTVLWVPTLEGGHEASEGDWIIQGVKGECYPCKPDIFAMTYEPVMRDEALMAHCDPGFDKGAHETSCVGCAQGWRRQSNYPDSTKHVHCPPRFIDCTAVKTSTESSGRIEKQEPLT
jgi:hypothetical protein